MITSETPDPQRVRGEIARWENQKVPNGTSVNGYFAGPVFWAWTHFIGVTKPCRKKMSKGALSCPYCVDNVILEMKGYLPFYDRDYLRKFVLIREELSAAVAEFELHAQLCISRAKSSKASIIPRAEKFALRGLPPQLANSKPVHILPALLLIWKDAELHNFSRKKVDPAEVIGSKLEFAGKPLKETESFKDFANLRARMSTPVDEPSLLGASLKDAMPPDATPSTNGKHRKKK